MAFNCLFLLLAQHKKSPMHSIHSTALFFMRLEETPNIFTDKHVIGAPVIEKSGLRRIRYIEGTI